MKPCFFKKKTIHYILRANSSWSPSIFIKGGGLSFRKFCKNGEGFDFSHKKGGVDEIGGLF